MRYVVDQLLSTGETITLVHFMHKDVPATSQQTFMRNEVWRIACMPNMTEFYLTPHHPSPHRTDDVRAMNCPACKETAAYKKALAVLEAKLGGPISVAS